MSATDANLYVGVDGGGTKTRAAVYRGGEELGVGTSGPANPISAGVDVATGSIARAIDAALGQAAVQSGDVAGIGLGIAGVGASAETREELRLYVEGRFRSHVSCWTDVACALAGAFGGQSGVLVVGGTGSVALGFDGERLHQVGGWGRRLGDHGSGYAILRAAVRAVLGVRDGLVPDETRLTGYLTNSLRLTSIDGLIGIFARDPSPEELVRGVAAVITAADAEDPTAISILEDAGRALARIAAAAQRRLARPTASVVAMGGVAAREGHVRRALREALVESGCELVDPWLSPEAGAAKLVAESVAHTGGMAALLRALDGVDG